MLKCSKMVGSEFIFTKGRKELEGWPVLEYHYLYHMLEYVNIKKKNQQLARIGKESADQIISHAQATNNLFNS